MKAFLLATAAGLACVAGASAQPSVQFNSARFVGNTQGDGTNPSGQPLGTTGGGQASFTTGTTGGSGQTGGGLVDNLVQVGNALYSANATIVAVPGGWTRSRVSTHGEMHLLQPPSSGYTVSNLFSSLQVLDGDQNVQLNLNTANTFFFMESSGTLAGHTSLQSGATTYPSGSTINIGNYVMLSDFNGFVSWPNGTQNQNVVQDGMLSVYMAAPRCASALAWSRRSQTGPSARYVPSLADDRDRGRLVLFGGGTAVPQVRYNDLWEWDGVSWAQRQTDDGAAVGRPSRRRGAAMAYDSTAHRFYLYGGETDAGPVKEFWRLDAATLTWTNLSASLPAGLSARGSAMMAYDRERHVCVLYGGSTNGPDPTDTWEFNGTTWTLKASATNPGPRISPGMTFDTLRGRTVLFGGGSSTQLPATDTPWVWDGTSWTSLSTNAGPTPRYGPGFAFDE